MSSPAKTPRRFLWTACPPNSRHLICRSCASVKPMAPPHGRPACSRSATPPTSASSASPGSKPSSAPPTRRDRNTKQSPRHAHHPSPRLLPHATGRLPEGAWPVPHPLPATSQRQPTGTLARQCLCPDLDAGSRRPARLSAKELLTVANTFTLEWRWGLLQ